MKESETNSSNSHWFKSYKDYWIGILSMAIIYNVIAALTGRNQYGFMIEIIFGTLLLLLFIAILSGLTFLIAWIFKRNFTTIRFIKIFTVWTFVNLLFKVTSLLLP